VQQAPVIGATGGAQSETNTMSDSQFSNPSIASTAGTSQAKAPAEASGEVPAKTAQPAYNPEFDTDKLTQEKEAEIQGYLQKLDKLNEQITEQKTVYDRDNTKKALVDEEKKEMSENLRSIQKEVKKKREIVQELNNLGNQDLKVLQQQVGEIKKELDDLNEEWAEYKKPINDEIFQQKQDITDMKVEY